MKTTEQEYKIEEVELTQYRRPDGHKVKVYAPVGKEYAEKAKHLILSCEVLTTGQIAIYARRDDQPEDDEICLLAENVAGDSDSPKKPTDVLKRLIDKVI